MRINLESMVKKIQHESIRPPGTAVAYFEGKKLTSSFDGYKRKNSNVHPELSDYWHIGSCAKLITSFIIFQMIENKYFCLDSKLKEITNRCSKEIRDLSIISLLTHTSGIVDSQNDDLRKNIAKETLDPISGRSLIASKILPGNKKNYTYSNYGYCLLGWLIDQLLNQYEEVARKIINRAIDEYEWGIGDPGKLENNCSGHCYYQEELHQVPEDFYGDNPMCMSPAGCFYITIGGWHKLLIYIMKESVKFSNKDNFFYNERDSYCASALIRKQKGDTSFYIHTGSNNFWYATNIIIPKNESGLLIASNWGGINNNCYFNKYLSRMFIDSYE